MEENLILTKNKKYLFRDAFLCLQETASSLRKTLTVHGKPTLCCHIFPFVKHAGCGMLKYIEQCEEAIHAKSRPTYKDINAVKITKDGVRLKTAVVNFGIKRL